MLRLLSLPQKMILQGKPQRKRSVYQINKCKCVTWIIWRKRNFCQDFIGEWKILISLLCVNLCRMVILHGMPRHLGVLVVFTNPPWMVFTSWRDHLVSIQFFKGSCERSGYKFQAGLLQVVCQWWSNAMGPQWRQKLMKSSPSACAQSQITVLTFTRHTNCQIMGHQMKWFQFCHKVWTIWRVFAFHALIPSCFQHLCFFWKDARQIMLFCPVWLPTWHLSVSYRHCRTIEASTLWWWWVWGRHFYLSDSRPLCLGVRSRRNWHAGQWEKSHWDKVWGSSW